jgi:quercetin dioxygenase-like cupin family protein
VKRGFADLARRALLIGLAFVVGGSGDVAMAQESNSPRQIVRKDLLTAAIAGRKDVARVEIKQIDFVPAQRTGVHRHPCPVVGYVARGSIRFQVEGQAAQLLSAGSAFFEPAGAKVVQFDNASNEAPATFVAFYLLGTDERQLIEMLE